MAERTADPPPRRTEQRRGMRFSVVIPVEVKWQEPGDQDLQSGRPSEGGKRSWWSAGHEDLPLGRW